MPLMMTFITCRCAKILFAAPMIIMRDDAAASADV